MTNVLLLIIVVIEITRIILFALRANMLRETYATTTLVYNQRRKVKEDDVAEVIEEVGKHGYEITAVTYSGFCKSDSCHYYTIFYSKKKIENFLK